MTTITAVCVTIAAIASIVNVVFASLTLRDMRRERERDSERLAREWDAMRERDREDQR